jgi:hypothetical protein
MRSALPEKVTKKTSQDQPLVWRKLRRESATNQPAQIKKGKKSAENVKCTVRIKHTFNP